MVLIQDIAGPRGSRAGLPRIRRTGVVAVEKIAKLHQATIIPTPRIPKAVSMDMIKRVPLPAPKQITDISRMPGVSLPIAKASFVPVPPPVPTKDHYKDFRPHPLLQKTLQKHGQPQQSRIVLPPAPLHVPHPAHFKPDISGPARPAARQQAISDFVPASRQRRQKVSAISTVPSQAPPAIVPARLAPVRAKIFDFVQYPLIAAAAVGIAYSPTVGQIVIGIYLLLALILRISSRVTFAVALVLLVCIPFFQVLGQTVVSENVAVYAYEMLVVGTLQAIIELWRDNRKIRNMSGNLTGVRKTANQNRVVPSS